MPIKLIVFDHDGTLVKFPNSKQHTSSWGAVFIAAGLQKEREEAHKFYASKKELAVEWAINDIKCLKGIPVKKVTDKVFPPHFLPGVKETMPKIRKMFPNAKIGIISGGLDLVTKETARELSLDFQVATEIKIENGCFTGKPGRVVDIWKKDEIFREMLKLNGILPEDACYIGDHDIDTKSFKLCKYSIAVHPDNENVKNSALAWTDDFKEIPAILKNFSIKNPKKHI